MHDRCHSLLLLPLCVCCCDSVSYASLDQLRFKVCALTCISLFNIEESDPKIAKKERKGVRCIAVVYQGRYLPGKSSTAVLFT